MTVSLKAVKAVVTRTLTTAGNIPSLSASLWRLSMRAVYRLRAGVGLDAQYILIYLLIKRERRFPIDTHLKTAAHVETFQNTQL